MSSGLAHVGKIREKFSGIRVEWDADYSRKFDQAGCLSQVDWTSPFKACANLFGNETAYDILIDNGRQLNLDVKHKIKKWERRNFLSSERREETISPEWDYIHFM